MSLGNENVFLEDGKMAMRPQNKDKVSDFAGRRWAKANRKSKGGWSVRGQWYLDQQQRRLLEREANCRK
jgi:hypothetical protein